jgi:hypothetical protein
VGLFFFGVNIMNAPNVVKTIRSKTPATNSNTSDKPAAVIPVPQSLTLYELSQEYRQALAELTDPELELPAEVIADTLEGLQGSVEDKAINIAKFFRNLEAVTDAIKLAEERMAKRRKTIESRVAWLKDYLKQNMEGCGIQKIESPWFVLAVQNNPWAVEISNEEAIPAKYKEKVVAIKLDKLAIKRALEEGKTVPGASLTRGTRLSIR